MERAHLQFSLSIGYLFLMLSNKVTHCQLFSFEQAADAVLYISALLCCETSVLHTVSLSFQWLKYILLRGISPVRYVSQSCADLNINDCSKVTGFLLQLVMGAQGTWLEALHLLLNRLAEIPAAWQQLCHVTAEKVMLNLVIS